jgi:hypothetical protein
MISYDADVVIVGGGPGGVVAALAARRMGARVMLVEKHPCFGGMAVVARVHSMLTFHGLKGEKIVGGLAEEIIRRLRKAGGTCGHIMDTVGVAYSVTPTDPDLLGLILQAMLDEDGVEYFLETSFIEARMAGERIQEIRCIGPGGPFSVSGRVFIDGAEGSLAASCGCESERGRNGACMPATLIFSLRNVGISEVCDYMESHRNEFHPETLFNHLRRSPAIGVSGFFSLWKASVLSIPRDRLLFYQTLAPDEVAINSTRITNFDPLVPALAGSARRKAMEQALEIIAFLRAHVPGFGSCRIATIAPALGVREVRRIRGRYWLTGKDVAGGRRFADEIALGGFPIDVHLPDSSGIETTSLAGQGFYGIPYRCLLPEGMANLMMVGKCLSADFEAHASARVQATTMAMGQAAGCAAALAVLRGLEPCCVPPEDIRAAIVEQGGILEPRGAGEELP